MFGYLLRTVKFLILLLLLNNCTYWPLANGMLASLIEKAGSNNNLNLLLSLINPSNQSGLDSIYFEALDSSPPVGSSQNIKTMAKNIDGSFQDISDNPNLSLVSSNSSILSISGKTLQALVLGSASVTATYQGKSVSQGLDVGGTPPGAVTSTALPDTTGPTITRVASYGPNVVRVFFSEPVTTSVATTLSNYKIVLSSNLTGSCSDNSNFTSSSTPIGILGTPSATTLGFNLSSVTAVSSSVYSIQLSHNQSPGARYTLLVDKSNIRDLAPAANLMECSNSGDFIGDEPIKLLSARCVNTTEIALTFSKPVLSGFNVNNSGECDTTTTPSCSQQYKLPSALGSINFARRFNGIVCGGAASDDTTICINHTLPQSGATFTMLVANANAGDGFDNTGTITINSDTTPTSSLKPSEDRASFSGCGTVPLNLADGPLLDDPFGDGSTYGDLANYSNRVLIGPNRNGSFAIRFNHDGSLPTTQTFQFERDTNATGSRTSQNIFSGLASAIGFNYSSIGTSGCSIDTFTTSSPCGPNNQDGRGLFQSGIIDGVERLILTGSKISQDRNDYVYVTSDTDNTLNFSYIDMGQILNNLTLAHTTTSGITPITNNKGSESILIHNNDVYFSIPATDPKKPVIVRIDDVSIREPVPGLINTELSLFAMPNIGWSGNGVSDATRNFYDILGGTLYTFNSRIYLGNSGKVNYNFTNCSGTSTSSFSGLCFQIGGIIRSTVATPARCTALGTCSQWVDISPNTDVNYNATFSNPIRSINDLRRSNRPVPDFETFNGNLYFIRNACDHALIVGQDWWSGNNDMACPVGREKPQLWKCIPSLTGSATDCDAGDWSLVAGNAVNVRSTNLGDPSNQQITLLKRNGSRLYIGFNNPNGIQVFRTRAGVTNPIVEADFEAVSGPTGVSSFGNQFVQEIFSSVSLTSGSISNLYISVGGKNGGTPIPVRVYRQINN